MKVQKIDKNFKTCRSNTKKISNSKARISKRSVLPISNGCSKLQVGNSRRQAVLRNRTSGLSSRMNLLNPFYSKKKKERKNIGSFESFSTKNIKKTYSVDKGKTVHLCSVIREERIKDAKTKLAHGYYSKNEVYSKLAEKIIDILI